MKRTGIAVICTLMLLGFTFSDSDAQIGFKGVGAHLGYVDAEGIDGTIMFGGHVNLGEIIPGLSLVPSVDYWKKSASELGIDVDFSQLSVNANVAYALPVGESINVMAIGGIAWVRVKADVSVSGFGSASGTDSGIGLNLGGIVSVPVSDNLSVGGGIIYTTEGEQLKIVGGFTFWLGQ
jgi:opacity protein-like surface antigen